MVKWYSLFSHTGKETEAVQGLLEDKLHLETAITNNMAYDGPLPCVKLSTGKAINEWLMTPGNVESNSIVTLNGYMRIVPEDVLGYLKSIKCKVYNIHPAPIQLYPELRGKDPQERMYEGTQKREYNYTGVVIHEVDEGVDTGKIVHWVLQLADPSMTKDELYERLHELGTQAWESFFRERMYEHGENN